MTSLTTAAQLFKRVLEGWCYFDTLLLYDFQSENLYMNMLKLIILFLTVKWFQLLQCVAED